MLNNGDAVFAELRRVLEVARRLKTKPMKRLLELLQQGYSDANFGTSHLDDLPNLFEADVFRAVGDHVTMGEFPSHDEMEVAAIAKATGE